MGCTSSHVKDLYENGSKITRTNTISDIYKRLKVLNTRSIKRARIAHICGKRQPYSIILINGCIFKKKEFFKNDKYQS